MIEYPSEEWIERLGRVFGRFRNKSVVLRGDGRTFHRNTYEVALVYIYKTTIKYYREHKIGTYYAQQKHLADQERTLWLLAHNFDIKREKIFEPGGGRYDFIARPMGGAATYDTALADFLYISDLGEIPLILDFQYYNHVLVEGYGSVQFIQGLHFYTKFFLKNRFPVVQNETVEVLEKWIYHKVTNFNTEEQNEFHWYELEYKYPEKNQEKTTKPNNQDDKSESANPTHFENQNASDFQRENKWIYLCSESDLLEYFDLLKQPNPNNGKPLLDKSAIEWIVGYYFGNDNYTIDNKPQIRPNLKRKDLMFFIYQFSTIVSPGVNRDGGVRLADTVLILKECFPILFKAKPKSIADQISRVSRDYSSEVKDLLNLKNHKDLLHRIGNNLRGA